MYVVSEGIEAYKDVAESSQDKQCHHELSTRHHEHQPPSFQPQEHQHVARGINIRFPYNRPTNQTPVQHNAPENAAPASFSLSYGAPTSAFGDTVGTSDRNRTSICREAELELEIDRTCERHKPLGFLDDIEASTINPAI